MSIVQAVICEKFALVCGDKRAVFSDGRVSESFNKITKINEHTLVGITGSIENNMKWLTAYNDANITSSTMDNVLTVLTEKFNNMLQEHIASNYRLYSIFSVVCGWNSSNFIAHTFFMGEKDVRHQGITSIQLSNENDVKFVSCGDDQHFANFMRIKDRYPFNIRGMKNTFMDVLNEGIIFDQSINNEASFECIRKVDIIR